MSVDSMGGVHGGECISGCCRSSQLGIFTEKRATTIHGGPPIICLCGSTRFAQVFNEVAIAKTLAGYIVLRPEVVTYDGDTDPQFDQPEVKEALDELHKRKIDLADSVFVIDVDGYIGPSTRSEIEYAEGLGIPVEYYNEKVVELPLTVSDLPLSE